MLHYECKLSTMYMKVYHECGRTEEEEGESMQSINQEKKAPEESLRVTQENKLTKKTKMPFPTVAQSLPFLSGKREGRKQRSDINSVWHSKTGLGACRHLLLRYNESCVFFEELIRQAPLTFIRAW